MLLSELFDNSSLNDEKERILLMETIGDLSVLSVNAMVIQPLVKF
jgi:hypothetical protein